MPITDYPFRNLVFEGGGVKGVAYVGALRLLEAREILPRIGRVGGTSAGAINATLLALGYTLADMTELLSELDFEKFMDDDFGGARDFFRVLEHFGWHKGDYFRRWMGERIREKTENANATFNDLKRKHCRELFLIGANLSTGYSEVFSHERTGDMPVVEAVRISMSIPLFFAAVRTPPRKDVYVDGGLIDNYPVKVFDRDEYVFNPQHKRETPYYQKHNATGRIPWRYVYNKETLGFRLDPKSDIAVFWDGAAPKPRKIDDFSDYARCLVSAIMNLQNSQHLHSDDWSRTIYIDTLGIGSTEFKITEEQKAALIASGEAGTRKYLEWYDANDPRDPPVNHPSN